MRTLLAVLLLVSCAASADDIFKPTGRYAVTVDSPAESPKTVSPDPPSQASRKYLAMFTASWCGPCQDWKRNVLPRLKAAGYHVELIDMDLPSSRKYLDNISRYPGFVACDWKTGKWLSDVMVGGISFETAAGMLGSPQPKLVAKAVTTSLSPPARYIQWPGWGTIDLETYSRDCNCSMCVSIRSKQQEYWRQMEAFRQSQTAVPPDQEGCPHAVVDSMLSEISLRAGDVLCDLGCGDGRICIAAARKGIKAIGIEIDPARAETARRNVRAAGLEHLVTIETGDALEFDTGRCTVASAFLYPPLLAKLGPRLKGLRVVASPYHEIPGLKMSRSGDVWIYRGG